MISTIHQIACRIRSPHFCLLVMLLAFVFVSVSGGQEQSDNNPVAAFVDDQPILVSRLQLQVDLVLTKTPATGRKLEIIKAQVLEENIKQRLVNLYLQNSKFKATDSEIQLQLGNVKKDIAAQKSTLDKFLKQRGITEKQLIQSIGWDLAWAKYVDNFLTDTNLQKYFDQNRRRFDGTQLRVAHILFKPDDINDSKSWDKAFADAKSVFADIEKGKIEFEKAVVQFSSGATKINNGELGWIGWRGPMAREFTISSFQLKPGQISVPTRSGFGFHLIKLLEEKPGTIKMTDIRPQVAQQVKRYLFDFVGNNQAKKLKIQFTGKFPYFEFGTKKLVVPK